MTADAETSHPDAGESYESWVGRIIDGRYQIDSLLGEGGMGAVFEAEHLKLMKRVALKVIHPEFAGDGEVAERFAREAMASAQLEHPHVATATDYGTLPEGGAYLVMQLVQGESLSDRLDREGAMDWALACEVIAQVADALSTAHKKGIVHRDLKPDNVMLEPRDDGTILVKVLDFGIARVASDAAGKAGPALTRVGTVIGTPGYMAPEQALGEEVDYRIDLYALGLLLYEMITGTPVFDLVDLTAIVTRQLTEEIEPLANVADVPAELSALVMRALDRKKDQRPESAAAMRDGLRHIVLDATIRAVASGETELPPMAGTGLASARRDPTPTGPHLPERPVPPPRDAVPSRRRVATAKTALAMEAIERRKVPLSILALSGCGGLALLAALGVGLVLFSSDGALSAKGENLVESGNKAQARRVEERRRRREAAAPEPTPTPAPSPIEALTDTPAQVPEALTQAAADLMVSEGRNTRRRAARQVLAHEPADEVPRYLREVAELENTSVCRRKLPHVVALGEIGDPRALPALDRIDAQPTNGCRRGLFQRFDCYGCLRDELATTLQVLRERM